MNSIVFVLFGITGDLARHKIMPALLRVARSSDVPIHFVGYGRRNMTQQEFKDFVVLSTGDADLAQISHYIVGELDDSDGYAELATYISSLHPKQSLFYLALPPQFYERVVMQLASAGLSTDTANVLLEKPFGLSGALASMLELTLEKTLTEQQIYRVDHFLGKSTIRTLREKLVNQLPDVTDIGLKLWETTDAAGRGALYDELGTSRDMIQNHVLAILTQLLAANPRDPASRAQHLNDFSVHAAKFGQYKEFRSHPGVDVNSETETFIAFKGMSGTIRIEVETGKALAQRHHLLTLEKDGRILAEVNLDTDDNAYETLLRECIASDRTYFVSWPEIVEQWRITETLLQFKKGVIHYPVGSEPSFLTSKMV